MRQVLHASGSASPTEAWDRYLRPARWSEWSPQIRWVSYTGDVIEPGATGVVHGPLGLRVSFTIQSVDVVGLTWAWSVRVGPIRLALQHSVSGAASGSSTELLIDGPAPVVLAYVPIAQLALTRLVRR